MASNGAIDYIVAFIGNFDCWRLNTDLPISSMTDARLDAEHLLLFARFCFGAQPDVASVRASSYRSLVMSQPAVRSASVYH